MLRSFMDGGGPSAEGKRELVPSTNVVKPGLGASGMGDVGADEGRTGGTNTIDGVEAEACTPSGRD